MSIDRQHNKINFICDSCGDDLETGRSSFEGAREKFKEENWLNVRIDETTWHHVCPSCSKEGK